MFVRTRVKKQRKGPIQLDLFEPHELGFEFKVIITNKELQAKWLLQYHEERGSQEAIFGELKSHCSVDYIPVRTFQGNLTYLLAGLFSFNLMRELQMIDRPADRRTPPKRASLWSFERVDTIRKTLVQRAGRLSRPEGKLTLTFCSRKKIKARVERFIDSLNHAA